MNDCIYVFLDTYGKLIKIPQSNIKAPFDISIGSVIIEANGDVDLYKLLCVDII
jgi:hypothetical protein